MSSLAAILRAFADLAPAGTVVPLDVTSAYGPFAWLGAPENVLTAFSERPDLAPAASVPYDRSLRRLAGLDALHRDERLLRAGWVFLAGTAEIDGARRRICMPLLSRPVRLRGRVTATLVPAGDIELLGLLDDSETAATLEAGAQFGHADATADHLGGMADLQRWISEVCAAAGVRAPSVLPPSEDPRRHVGREGLVAVIGVGVYAARDVAAIDLGSTLRSWAAVEGLPGTAFGALYGGHGAAATHEHVDDSDSVVSPLPLTDAQADVVRRARRDPVSVVSGAPGNGKSHALVATAIDAVAAGRSVLVVTQSLHAAEVLTELLERYPGPTPVVFGSSEHREAIATQLAGGLPAGPSRRGLAAAEQAVDDARRRVASLRAAIAQTLDRERLAGSSDKLAPLLPSLQASAPGAFAPAADHERLGRLLADATAAPPDGWWARRRTGRAQRRLRRAVRADGGLSLDRLALALEAARARRAAAELAASGGTTVGAAWDELADAEQQLAAAAGALVDARVRDVPSRARRGAAALGAALRAGRGRRREMLARMGGTGLVEALPLWIGTLRDVEDLLPRVPGLFDLAILDEASQIDQPRAAPALLRARRALIAGDPRQLRHVSFVADLDVAARLDEHGLTELADLLDVRRASALDAGVAATGATWLDEHFRSVPHLIAFSAARFYTQPIRLVTMHPQNERATAIEIVRVDGCRTDAGVNIAEVTAVADVLRDLRGTATSVGVVSPFRAQADALEDMILAGYDVASIERLGLTAGTVHELQGNERDVVVVSLALSADDPPAARRFLEDPNLFNVMVTRARRQVIVVTSLPEDPGSLVGEYFTHARQPPVPPDAAGTVGAWTRAIHDELAAAGIPVRAGYPVGRWRVDLCVGDGAGAVAVETEVHEGGSAAHIDRQRTLRTAGWPVVDAFPTRYGGDAVTAAVELAARLRRCAGPP